ncbi:MAG: transposase [Lentisphaeria bacterium]|jgi:transposase
MGWVVEPTYNWYCLVDGLMNAGHKVHLGNTVAIQQYSGLKHGDDESDANCLANMLRLGLLHEGYIYPKEERTQRDLLRKRIQLVQQQTLNLLSIQGLYVRHLNIRLNANKLKQLNAKNLEQDFANVNVHMAVNGNLMVRQCLTQQINTVEK